MRKTRRLFILLFIITVFPIFVFPQTNPGIKVNITGFNYSQYPRIRAYVSVTDKNGKSILGLKKEHFNSISDKNPLSNFELTSIFPNKEWLSIILAIDCSGSMSGRPFSNAKKAAIDFITRAGKNDRIQIMSFHSDVRFHSDLTTKKDELIKTVEKIKIGKNTALYSAVSAAVDKLKDIKSPRKAIVILSDGKNTVGKINMENSHKSAEKTGIPIYTVGLGKDINRNYLKLLSSQTGGYSFFTLDPDKLIEVYQLIAGQLQNQYVIIYELQDDKSTTFHQIEVMVNYKEMKAKQKKLFSPFIQGRDAIDVGKGKDRVSTTPTGIKKVQSNLLLFSICGAFLGILVALVIVSTMKSKFSKRRVIMVVVYFLSIILFTSLGILIAII